MNKKLTFSVVALAIFSVAACSTSKDINLITPCKFSNGDDAPAWTCNEDIALNIPSLANVTWVTGEAKKLKAGRSLQKKTAVLDGRRKLLEIIAVRVESLLQQQARGTSAEDAIESFVQSFAEGLLGGSRPYSSTLDPNNGEIYVIVGITDEQFKENIAANKQYQELREAILASGNKAMAARIDSGLDRISKAKKNIGLEGARKIALERSKS